jgi:hypothetical protein
MQGKMVLNTGKNATKWNVKSIKIHLKCINKTF